MSKILFEFTMPDDSDDYKVHAQALKLNSLLYELSNELRTCIKYGKPTARDRFWQERFWELVKESGVEIV